MLLLHSRSIKRDVCCVPLGDLRKKLLFFYCCDYLCHAVREMPAALRLSLLVRVRVASYSKTYG